MKQRIEDISNGLNKLIDEAESLLRALANGSRRVDGAVRSHPCGALAASAIAGFFAGLLVRRR